jgi:hypothetical protein
VSTVAPLLAWVTLITVIPVLAHGTVDVALLERVRAFTSAQRTLEDVVRDVLVGGGALLDVVVQDEFTHDVIVRWLDRGHAQVLVYDTT